MLRFNPVHTAAQRHSFDHFSLKSAINSFQRQQVCFRAILPLLAWHHPPLQWPERAASALRGEDHIAVAARTPSSA